MVSCSVDFWGQYASAVAIAKIVQVWQHQKFLDDQTTCIFKHQSIMLASFDWVPKT